MKTTDLKQKTAALRQQHILEAAIRVFAEQGYRGATIKAIASEAGVSDGTIYNVFENKEALLFGVLESLLHGGPVPIVDEPFSFREPQKILEQVISARWQTMTPKALSMMRVIWAEALTDRALAKRYVSSSIKPALSGFEQLLKAIAPNEHVSSADMQLLQRSIVGTYLGLTLLKLFGDPVLDKRMDDVPPFLSKFVVAGISQFTKDGVHSD
jgi:AcrR family transcriptional regulator